MTRELDIIIPVYNDQDGLNTILSSIENQSVSTVLIRVLVVDNNSCPAIKIPPTSFEVHLLHCAQAGSYAARNIGLTKIQSKIVAFTDADCILDANWVSTGIKNINITSKQLCRPVFLREKLASSHQNSQKLLLIWQTYTSVWHKKSLLTAVVME